ncbi:hypothetical protein CAter282_3782 [Collimonas arenae]|uniref:Uncharacterized protein n=1 Tax=Collimonas arenae TaxID=279058 RepID=A0A127PUX6_9BURK|nr:hypothetical protein CAter10_4130 [Collimonas arenae]AMP11460.1 hypothetical protein CAter282_3782 [Collimonas arenae]
MQYINKWPLLAVLSRPQQVDFDPEPSFGFLHSGHPLR